MYDYTVPSAPILLDTVSRPDGSSGGSLLTWEPGLVLWELDDDTAGLSQVDISSATSVTVGLPEYYPLNLLALARHGNRVVAGSGNGIVQFDPFDPDMIEPISLVPTTGTVVQDVALDGSLLYVLASGGVLEVLDVTDASSPVPLFGTPVAGGSNLEVEGGFAYVGKYAELEILDVSGPGAPISLGTLPLAGTSERIEAAGTWVHCIDNDDYVVVDVSTPSAPVETGRLAASSQNGVGLWGDFAYVGTSSMLQRIDPFANPNPKVKATVPLSTSSAILDLVVRNGLAYVVTTLGLTVVDLEPPGRNAAPDPPDPVEIGSLVLGGPHRRVALAGNFAYVTAQARMYVVDVSVPTAPVLEGVYNSGANAVAATEDLVAIRRAGDVVDLLSPQCGAAAIGVPSVASTLAGGLAAAPNPFRSTTELTFSLPHAGHATLTLHDVRGRLVASLMDREIGAGVHRVPWSPAGDGAAPAGAYFARLEGPGGVKTTRIVHLPGS